MEQFFGIFLGIGVLATLLVLVIGIISFAVHGPFYQKHGNNLMRLRVLFQGIAVATLALGVWLAAS
jgi:ABC-type dipeptide/oligopeptide/nickel transport system permease subunit